MSHPCPGVAFCAGIRPSQEEWEQAQAAYDRMRSIGPMPKDKRNSPSSKYVDDLHERRVELRKDPEYAEFLRLCHKFKELGRHA